jgi:hypothetical protein
VRATRRAFPSLNPPIARRESGGAIRTVARSTAFGERGLASGATPPAPMTAAPAFSTSGTCASSGLRSAGSALAELAAIQPVENNVCQVGHHLAPGPGQGRADHRQHPGPQGDRYRCGFCSDKDGFRLWPDGGHTRGHRFCDENGLFGAGGYARFTFAAQRLVYHSFALQQVEGAVGADVQARTAAGAAFILDDNQGISPPSSRLRAILRPGVGGACLFRLAV